MTQNHNFRPKILCVDDEPAVTEALTRVLRGDFSVLQAGSAEEALNVLRQNLDCAVVLSDYRMPGTNGIELLKQVKNISPNTVRAILSGQIEAQNLVEAINSAEIHRFILKPWDNEVLRLQMLEALQAHASLAERNELHHLAITDPVTQLTNHRYFQEKLRHELKLAEASKTPLTLVMIDVDHFKSFNDHYGHPEGDRLLAEVADRIRAHFPEKGLASRYGGEEFVIILPRTTGEQAFSRTEQLRLSLETKAFLGPFGRPAHITVSAGIATYPDDASTAAELVSAADRALYQAKRQGRNQTVSS